MEPGDEELLVRRVVKEIMCSVMGDDDGDVDEDDTVGGMAHAGAASKGLGEQDVMDGQDT
jgi:hypothetical protein